MTESVLAKAKFRSLSAVITDKMEHALRAVEQSEDDNFCVLVEKAGLNPENSFRNGNLRGVDFTNCDLRGYDFTGADLRECSGAMVTWDASTKLDGVDARGSIFQHEVRVRQAQQADAQLLKRCKILLKSDWVTQAVWAADLYDGKTHEEYPALIATYVIEHTDDNSARIELLEGLEGHFSSEEEYMDYVHSILARRDVDDDVFIYAIRILTTATVKDDKTVQLLRRLIFHGHFSVGYAALQALARFSGTKSLVKQITADVYSPSHTNFRVELLRKIMWRWNTEQIANLCSLYSEEADALLKAFKVQKDELRSEAPDFEKLKDEIRSGRVSVEQLRTNPNKITKEEFFGMIPDFSAPITMPKIRESGILNDPARLNSLLISIARLKESHNIEFPFKIDAVERIVEVSRENRKVRDSLPRKNYYEEPNNSQYTWPPIFTREWGSEDIFSSSKLVEIVARQSSF